MSRPIPSSLNPKEYEVEVLVRFAWVVEADDEQQAEEIASYDYAEHAFHATIEDIDVSYLPNDIDDLGEFIHDEE